MRKDGKPLTEVALEIIWMFHDRLLDIFGDDPAVSQRMMNKKAFDKFCENYKEEYLHLRPSDFEHLVLPL